MQRALVGSIVVAVALVGCGDKKNDGPGGSATGTATAAATGTGAATGSGPATGQPVGEPKGSGTTPPLDERCADPCRLLAGAALADIDAVHDQLCGKRWERPPATDCDALDYQRNCIYAHHGYTFKKAKWKDTFGKTSWYRARADFKETDLSRVATNNIRDLKGAAATCRGEEVAPIPATFSASKVSKADLALVVGWFTQKAAGDPPLPKKLEADGQTASEADIRGWLSQKHLFTLESWTPIEYDDGKSTGHRRITASTGQPSPDCNSGDEDCEGFEWITFEIDEKNAIIGLSVGAAACPLVYVEHDDGALSYSGEILRGLARARREGSQDLALDAAATCGADARVVRLQLVEAKDELTLLDDVALVVGGVSIEPRSCVDAGDAGDARSRAAYCGNDARHFTLVRGQSLALVFDIPSGVACTSPTLRADGYYVPLVPTYTQR